MKNILFSVSFFAFLIFNFAPTFLFAQKDRIAFSKIWKEKFRKKDLKNLQIGRFYELEAQFAKPISTNQKQELEKLGVQLLDYSSNLTYRIGLPVDLDVSKLDLFPIKELKKIDSKKKIDLIFLEKTQNSVSKIEILLSKNAQTAVFLEKIQKYKPQNTEIQEYFNIISCEIPNGSIEEIAQFPEVVFISQIPENQSLNEWGNTQVRGSTLLEGYRKLDGSGVRIANFDLTNPFLHLDFAPRVTRAEILGIDNHSTGNVGIIGGTGAIDPYKKGIAPKTEFVSYYFSNIPYKMVQAIQNYGVALTNNPYGPGVVCSKPYSFTNHLEDRIAYDFPNVTHIFAAGNSQSTCGAWNNVVNIAKNTIIVGGTNIADLLTGIDAGTTTVGASSVGTSQDGRIIPHLAALGIGVQQTANSNGYWSSGLGTSQACPQVTGIAAQTLQRYRQLFKTDPPSSLIKAVLCNTASDIGNPYPDYRTGFGRPDALKAVRTFEQNRFRINKIQTAQNQSLTINIPQGASRVKVMIVWTDPPANIGANPTLVNDLNLKLTHTASGTVYNPWVLNPASPTNVATRGIDNRNNIEQVTIDNPIGGTYQIDIQGFNIAVGTEQEYALVWEFEEPHLEMTFPNGGETLRSGGTHYLRWNQAGTSGSLNFDYSLDNGATWNFAAVSSSATATWNLPANTFSNQARLRVRNGGLSDISDEVFTIAPQPVISSVVAGNNQLTLNWNAVTGATEYKVYLYETEKENWILVGNNITGTSHTITDLQNGVSYWLTVRCQNAAGVLGERAYAASGTPTGAGRPTDLQVIGIQNVTNWISSNSRPTNEFITIQIRNNGTATVLAGTTIPVSYQIDNQAIINENFTTANINPSEVFTYSFAASANLSAVKEYFISASVNLPTDFISVNNSFTKKLINKPLLKIIVEKTNPCGTNLYTDFSNYIQNYSISSIPLAMENMATGIAVNVPDNEISDAFPIGFKFNFFGKIYDKFFISNDGFILFDALGTKDFSSWDPQTLPNTGFPNNLIALSWADLDPSAGGTLKYQTFGTAPNRKLVVEFNAMKYWGTTNSITGQIVLYENTNFIELHNQNVLNYPTYTQTQGIENQLGTQAFTVAGRNRTNWNSINEGFRFTPDPATWLWNTAETTSSISPIASGSYSVTYTQGTNTYTASATASNACGTPPTITQVFPADNSVNVSVSSILEIIFDKNIRPDLGFLTISNGSQTFFISAGDLEKVQIKENKVSIKTPSWFNGNSHFFVKINANAFKDFEVVPNFFAGISNTTDWDFDTENQTPQDISLISRTLAENSPIGTLVGKLQTSDPDSQQTHTYTITGGASVFNIVGNEIRTNGTLNYTTNPNYILEITTTDNGTPAKNFKKWFNISIHQFDQPRTSPKNIIICSAGSTTLQARSNSAGTWQFVTAFSEISSLPVFSSANATITQVSNLQANTSYQFTFRNDNLANDRLPDPNATVMVQVLGNVPLSESTEKNWIGLQSDFWYDCRNWADENIPFVTSNIHIANSSIHQPVLDSLFYCQNLFISTGQNLDIQPFITVTSLDKLVINGNLKIEPNAHVFVTGNLTNNGIFDLKGEAYLASNYLSNNTLNLTEGTIHFISSTASQILGTVQPNFFNLILNKPNSLLTLAQKTGINGNLQFTTGKIQCSTANFLIFQDNASHSLSNDYSFVEGKTQKIGNDPFVFPIGKNNRFAPVELVSLANTDLQDHFTVEYFDTGFGTLTTAESRTYEVKNIEYWQIDRGGTANTTEAQIRLFWKNHSDLAFGTAADLAVGRWNGTAWLSEGQGAISGSLNSSGSVSSASFVTAFSAFTFVFQTVIAAPPVIVPPVVTPTPPVSPPINFYTDLRILWIASPLQEPCNQPLSKNETIKIRLRNTGTMALSAGISIPITYLEGGTAHTENWILPSFWQVGQEMDFTFVRKFDFSERRNYTFTIKLNYLADQNPFNNEIKQIINIKPAFQILASKPTLACGETVELRATNFPEGSKLVWEQNGKLVPFANYFITANLNALYSVRYENRNCTEKATFDLKETCLPILEKVIYDNSKNTITLSFSEAIQKGQGIIRITNGTEEILIDLNGLTIDNQTVTIILPKELAPNSEYKIVFESSNFTDLVGNPLGGNVANQNWTFPSNQSPKDLIFCPKILGKTAKIGLTLLDDFAPNPIFQIISSNIANLKIENSEIVGNLGETERLEMEIEGRDNGLPSLPIRKKISLQVLDYQVLDAGADQVICAAGSSFLQADERNKLGKGEWILAKASPTVSILPKIENRFSPFTQVFDLQANTIYEFVWKNQHFDMGCAFFDKEKIQITVLNQTQVAENQTVHWIGSQNYHWFDCRNWEERQIPNPTKNVVIKNDIPYPIFASEIALYCQNLTINPNQSLLLDESVLQINGNLSNKGYLFSPPNSAGTVEIGENLEQEGFLAQKNMVFFGQKESRIFGKNGLETENLTLRKEGKNLMIETPTSLSGNLVLENGKIQVAQNQTISFFQKAKISFSEKNFILGKITKIGKTNFTFPVGVGERLLKLEISDLENATENTQITLSFISRKPENEKLSDTLQKISLKGFWRIECANPKVSGKVLAFWDKEMTDSLDIEPEKLVLAKLENEVWTKIEGKTGLNGSFTVGSVSEFYKPKPPLATKNEILEKQNFNVVPNPLERNEIGIWLYSIGNQQVTIEVFDVLGRRIENFEAQLQSGENRLQLVPKNELGRGIYQIQIKEWTKTQKIWR